jgi:hypothetical protein
VSDATAAGFCTISIGPALIAGRERNERLVNPGSLAPNPD